MSKFDVKSNPAICVLPWVHVYKSTGSSIAGPCCHSYKKFDNKQNIEYVRKSMLDGKRPSICSRCYDAEDNNQWSFRLQHTVEWLKRYGEPDVEKPKVQYLDIRFDPTCNLKCKMCGPSESTLWQKEKGIKIPVNVDNKKILETTDKSELKKIYLAGGEPTYITSYLTFLEELYDVNPNCEVAINTNLKKLPEKWKKVIKKFKNLSIICSCDAIGDLGSYVRYPLGWEEFEENVEFVSKNANFLQFNIVASNLTVHKIHETCDWMSKYTKNIDISPLFHPKIFSEISVPMSSRQPYIDSLEKIKAFLPSIRYVTRFRSEVKAMIERYSRDNYDETAHRELLKEVKEQDSHRNVKLEDVDKFLHSWIYQ